MFSRGDIDKFEFLAEEDGYKVLAKLPEGEPAVVPRLDFPEAEKLKMAQFVEVPHGPVWT